MRVLILAPLWFPVSRDAHGGIETFLVGLIGALAGRGCRTALAASADSRTAARLLAAAPESLHGAMGRGAAQEYVYWEQGQLGMALRHADGFDLIHSHVGPGALALSAVPGLRVLHTWHTEITHDFEGFVARHPDTALSTVSEFQAAKLRRAGARRCAVVHNGVDVSSFESRVGRRAGLLFLGRMEAAKGVDLAVTTA
jgi:glycosyltransferase involved in cell wall biosynthesis